MRSLERQRAGQRPARRRWAGAVLVLGLLFGAGGPAGAVSVAVYGDPAFVDTRVDLNPVGSEWHNVVQSLYFYGHGVGSIPGTTAADFSAGLAGQRVLVVP